MFFLIVLTLSSLEQRITHQSVVVVFNCKAEDSEHINYFRMDFGGAEI